MDDFMLETDISASEPNNETSEDEKRRRRLKHRPDRCTESGFHKSTRLCMHAMREAILHHRWEEAARHLGVYSHILEEISSKQTVAFEIVWRLGVEILQRHPSSDVKKLNDLYELLKSSGVKKYAKICLEYAFHLLLNGQLQKAKQQLTVAMSWRYGKESTRQVLDLKLIHAYCGFLDYLSWSTKRASASDEDDCGQSHEMHSDFRQALVTMQEIIKQPGVWDQFVCSCVDMLDYYNNEEEALQLLKHYAYDKKFPANPNAHVYLYKFQKKHDAITEELLATLKGLHSLVPSHELMIEYCDLLIESTEEKNLQHALSIALDLLEFPCWKTELKGWHCVLKVAMLFKNKCRKQLLKKEFEGRRDLWVNLHYRRIHNKMDLQISPKLVSVKTKVKSILGIRSRYGEKRTQRLLNATHVLELR